MMSCCGVRTALMPAAVLLALACGGEGGGAAAGGGSSAGPGSGGSGVTGSGGGGVTANGGSGAIGSGGSGVTGSGGSGMTTSGGSGVTANGGSGAIGSGGSGAAACVARDDAFVPPALPSYCSPPTAANVEAARAAYETFKTSVVTADGAGGDLRVWRPDSSTPGSTVSEGMGYGMLLAVYHDDQTVFDALWRYVARYLNANGLMDWEVDADGSLIGLGAASDGDEDIAFALLMAARRWGGCGSLNEEYRVLGTRMVEAMWMHEVDMVRDYMWKPGDAWGDQDVTNLSYFGPAYFRVFGEATGNVEGWNAVIDGNYAILERTLNETLGNAENGLVPAWSNSLGEPVAAFDGAPTHFQNDSTRTPFRIGQDYCWFGEPRAKAYLDKIAAFYAGVGVANITDGYELDGTPRPQRPDAGTQAASFVGPAGVAFMSDARYQAELDQAWDAVATEQLTNGTVYYQKSWTALSLLMMSGAMVGYPAAP